MTAARKEIAQALDHAAARAETVGRAPATGKQCWFLAGLLAEAGETAADIDCGYANTSAILTKKLASFYIDQMLIQLGRKAA